MSKFSKITDAVGGEYITFYCSGCKEKHIYKVKGGGLVWEWNGDMEKATFSPSLLNTWPWKDEKRVCHIVLTDGKISYCGDCTHSLRGQVVEVEDIDLVDGSEHGECCDEVSSSD